MATPPTFTVGQVLTAAQMNAVGLWKVNTTTVTNQNSLNINNCFTSDYDNYKVIFTLTAVSANVNLLWQLRASGTNSNANYYWGSLNLNTLGTAPISSNSPRPAAQVNPSYLSTAIPQGSSTIELIRPNDAVNTAFQFVENFNDTTDQQIRMGGGIHLVASAYDGISFQVTGGATMSAVCRVYGYRD